MRTPITTDTKACGMDEETPSRDQRRIHLSDTDYAALKRAMQWPEDRAHYDRVARPTRLTEIQLA